MQGVQADTAVMATNNWKQHFSATRDVLKTVTKRREEKECRSSRSHESRHERVSRRHQRSYCSDDLSEHDVDQQTSASDYGASGDDLSLASLDLHRAPRERHDTSSCDSGMGSTDLKWAQDKKSDQLACDDDSGHTYETISEVLTPQSRVQESQPASDYHVQWDDQGSELYLGSYSPVSAVSGNAPLHSTLIGSSSCFSPEQHHVRYGHGLCHLSRRDPSGMEDPQQARAHCHSAESLIRHHDDSCVSSGHCTPRAAHSMECLETSLAAYSSCSMLVQQGSVLSHTPSHHKTQHRSSSAGSGKGSSQKTSASKPQQAQKPVKTKSGPFKFLKCCRPSKNKTQATRTVTEKPPKQKLNASHYSLESIDDRLGGGLILDKRTNCIVREEAPVHYPNQQQHQHHTCYPQTHHHPHVAPCFGCQRRETYPANWASYNRNKYPQDGSMTGYDSDATTFMAMRMCKPGVTEAVCRGPPVVGARWSMRGAQGNHHPHQAQLNSIEENFTTLALI